MHPSSSSLRTATVLKDVKVERSDVDITLLSDDSDTEPLPTVKEEPQSSHAYICSSSRNVDCTETPAQLDASSSSVLVFLRALRALKGSRNVLSRLDYDSIPAYAVQRLPPKFNGDVIFELPPVSVSHMCTSAKGMSGMDKRHNGHIWSKTLTTNITNSQGFTFKTSSCLGHLRCTNSSCEFLHRSHRLQPVNEMEWEGVSPSILDVGDAHPQGSTLVYSICKHPPSCVATCPARVYYVLGKQSSTRAFVHLGTHSHPVKDGELRDMRERTRSLIGEQMERMPSATNSSIVMEATKELLGEFLLRPEGDFSRVMDFNDLVPVLDKCKYITSPNIRNEVSSFKHFRKFGIIDSITKLRGASKWAFVQESKFLGQGTDMDKVFVFKMSEVGPGSGVDLMKRMQAGGDFECAWMMFNHVKRVKEWTTMACHVYDTLYCKVMTIAVCDMQSEDCTAQIIFWRNLNSVVLRNGLDSIQFKGFMADSAQANWNAVQIVYGGGDPTVPMENHERTCLFHWTQSLEKHTKADIRGDLQEQHRQLCKQYKNASSMDDAEVRYFAIKAWWLSSGVTTTEGLHRLELWLSFWHFRWRQWGGFMKSVSHCILNLPVLHTFLMVYAVWDRMFMCFAPSLYLQRPQSVQWFRN